MHERSLVEALLQQVGELTAECDGAEVEEIHVTIGPLSGVEGLLLEDAFTQLAAESSMPRARLILNDVPLVAYCESCDAEFEPEEFTFLCPRCDSCRVRIVQGDALILQSVTLHRREDQTVGARR